MTPYNWANSSLFLLIFPETSGTLAAKLFDNGILPPHNQYKRTIPFITLAIESFVLPLLLRHHQYSQTHLIFQSFHLNLGFSQLIQI
jgi:hypothetical protein